MLKINALFDFLRFPAAIFCYNLFLAIVLGQRREEEGEGLSPMQRGGGHGHVASASLIGSSLANTLTPEPVRGRGLVGELARDYVHML